MLLFVWLKLWLYGRLLDAAILFMISLLVLAAWLLSGGDAVVAVEKAAVLLFVLKKVAKDQ